MASAATQIVGRAHELEQLKRLVAGGEGAALVLEGEPGIGKTTLWRHGVELARTRGVRVLTAQPVEAERELSYAALGDLLAPAMSEVGCLAPPQRRALRVALLLAGTRGAPPEERAVAFAFASLLRLLAEDGPVLLAIDDLQWLDTPSAAVIAFAARRLDHPQQRLLAARRLGEAAIELAGAQQLAIAPLSCSEIGVLVRQRLETRLVAPTIEHLERVSGGNPLYALELAHELVERGRLRPGEPLPIPQSLRALLAGRLERLPPATRQALAVAAALARPTKALVEACVGAHVDLQPAVAARVVRSGGEAIEFAHPLFASVLYGELDAEGRRRVHRRLAELVEDLEERAGHVAAATDAPSEPAAALLGHAAAAALARGAPTNALALARLAVELTPPESAAAVRRRLAAATLEFDAGDARLAEEALELLVAEVPEADRALVLLEQARVVGELRGLDAALDIYREALASLSPDAPPRLAALVNARLARALAHRRLHVEAVAHAEAAVAVAERARDAAVLAESLAILAHVRYFERCVVQTELLERAVAVAVQTDVGVNNSPLFISVEQYLDQGQVEPARPLVEQLIAWTRARHDPALALALTYEGWIELRVGNTRRALELAREAHEVVRSAARGDYAREAVALAAVGASIVGDVEQCRRSVALLRTQGLDPGAADFAEGLLELSLRNYEAARALYLAGLPAPTADREQTVRFTPWLRAGQVAGLVEALVALDDVTSARALLDEEWETASRQPTIVGARMWHVRGLVSDAEGDADGAVTAFERALDVYGGFTSNPVHRGRVLLALGSSLRRRRQKRAARDALEAALGAFEAADAAIWAQHAQRELALTGGRRSSPGALTDTERQIAELVARGSSNQEVARELHLSSKTIEWNLTKIYRKLNIASRAQLARKVALREAVSPYARNPVRAGH